MAKEQPKLKLGKGAAFVKTHLKQLRQEDDVWEADFRALPKAQCKSDTHYIGLAVSLNDGYLRAIITVDYQPDANELADLLADAMRRPYTALAYRPRQILLRENPSWGELYPHLKQLGIEVSTQNDLPHVETALEDFRRELRRAQPKPMIVYMPKPTDVQKAFPAIAKWVQGYGHIEIGDQEGFGFIARAIDYGGVVFEDAKPGTLAEAMAALEKGLAEHFEREGIE